MDWGGGGARPINVLHDAEQAWGNGSEKAGGAANNGSTIVLFLSVRAVGFCMGLPLWG